MMKILVFLFTFVLFVESSEDTLHHPDDDLRCNFRVCGAELLNFESFGLANIFRKVEVGSFCIKNCTPPVIHEFFQSIIYSITKRIPHHCAGEDCADKNRFVALAKCVHDKAWPLLVCSKRLIDLAKVGLVDIHREEKRNTTCSIVVETTQCIEEILQQCGPQPFHLVKQIATDLIQRGVNHYCHPAFREKNFILPTTAYPPFQERMKNFTDILPRPGKHPYPQYVKAYHTDSAATSTLNIVALFACLWTSVLFFRL